MRIIYIGNRSFALSELRIAGMAPSRILCVDRSYLKLELDIEQVEYELLTSKSDLIRSLKSDDFDILVSSGCPYVLPIDELARESRRFVNVHPSVLPDLRGKSAIAGAFLFGRDAGATCHLMDSGIDTGPIIAQVSIPISDDLDTGLLYQMCWMAEKEVTQMAIARNFVPIEKNIDLKGKIYYTQSEDDMIIDWSADSSEVLRRIHAFGVPGKGAWFKHNGHRIIVRDARKVENPFLMQRTTGFCQNEVVFRYENKALIRKGDGYVLLRELDGRFEELKVGVILH